MPMFGAVVGLIVVVGLGGWTASRVQLVTGEKQAVETKRLVSAKQAAARAGAPPSVQWIQGKRELWQPVVEFEGTLAAARSADLGFEEGGRLGSTRVRLGDVVKSGEVLATLDANVAVARLKAAAAEVRAAKAQLALASDAERRTQPMVERGSLAEARGVETSEQRAMTEAHLDAAYAQQGLSQATLGNHTLLAPFAGTITKAPDGIGGVVAAGATLFSLVDLSTLRLKSSVSEDDAGLLQPGAPVEVVADRGVVKGKIVVVLGIVDPITRRVPVEAVLDNGGVAALRAGSFVRARVLGGDAIPVLRLPHEVLRPGSQDEVFVDRGGMLDGRQIVFAVAADGSLLVRRGITEGDQVIVAVTAEMKTGDRVRAEPTRTSP